MKVYSPLIGNGDGGRGGNGACRCESLIQLKMNLFTINLKLFYISAPGTGRDKGAHSSCVSSVTGRLLFTPSHLFAKPQTQPSGPARRTAPEKGLIFPTELVQQRQKGEILISKTLKYSLQDTHVRFIEPGPAK